MECAAGKRMGEEGRTFHRGGQGKRVYRPELNGKEKVQSSLSVEFPSV